MRFVLTCALLAAPAALHAGEWNTVTSDPGKFEVKFPFNPVYSKHEDETQTLHSFMARGGVGAQTFFVGCSNLRRGMLPHEVRKLIDKMTPEELKKAESVKEVDVTVSGHPGREVLARTSILPNVTAVVRFRTINAGDRVYFQFSMSRENRAAEEEARLFFDSFKILPETK